MLAIKTKQNTTTKKKQKTKNTCRSHDYIKDKQKLLTARGKGMHN